MSELPEPGSCIGFDSISSEDSLLRDFIPRTVPLGNYTDTLRDQFAMEWVKASFARAATNGSPILHDQIARDAYLIADALMEARAK